MTRTSPGQSWTPHNVAEQILFGGLVFVLVDPDGGLSYVKPDLTLRRLPSGKNTVYRPFAPAPQNGAISLKTTGNKTWVLDGVAIVLVASIHSAAIAPFEMLDTGANFNFAAPALLVKGRQRRTLTDIFTAAAGQTFSSLASLLSVTAIEKTANARFLVIQGIAGTAMVKEFTGRYSDGTYHDDGLVPFSFRDNGLFNETLRLAVLINDPASGSLGSSVGAMLTLATGNVIIREPAPSLLAYAAVSMGVLTHKYHTTGTTHLNSFCVSVSIAKSATTLWARRLRIYKIMLNASLTEISRSVLLEFSLNQQATEHAGSYSGIPLYNRDLNSVLGGYHLIEWYDGDVLHSYLGFIKKECAYSTQPVGATGVATNALTEVIKAVRIDLVSGVVTETVLDTRTITQLNNADNGATWIAQGSTHATELYYADFINGVYVIGGYDFTDYNAYINLAAETPPVPRRQISDPQDWSVRVYDGAASYALESAQALVFYNPTLFVGAPIPDGFNWTPWSLDNSLRGSAFDETGFSAYMQNFQIRRINSLQTQGVFSTNALGRNFTPGHSARSYFVDTVDGETTITLLRIEQAKFVQTPGQINA